MSLRSAVGIVRRRLLCSLYCRPVSVGAEGPFVSFAFDDFPRTAHTVGGSIMRSFGVRGTYYAAMGLMETSNELGEQFRLEDLHAASADGHELASHTFSHTSSRRVSLQAFQEDVRKGDSAIREVENLAPTSNFAYPFGEVSVAAKQVVGKEMLSCRGIYGGLNGPLIDLNLLRANSIYGDLDRLESARRLVRENEKAKGWLIFYTHDVRPNPSPFGCTPKLLEMVIRLTIQSSAKVLPVADVLAAATVCRPQDSVRQGRKP